MEPAFILARFVQYAAASILFGSTLLLLWAGLDIRGTRVLLAAAGVAMAIASAVALVVQTAMLAGSLTEALRLETLTLVMQSMAFGPAVAVRIVTGVVASLIVLVLPRSRQALLAVLVSGAVACISFAWSGHAAATEGSLRAVHLASDGAHALAAAGWVGSLFVFALMIWTCRSSDMQILIHALSGFFRLGVALVTVLLLTGTANTVFILGGDVTVLTQTTYGMLLIAKVAGFGVMFALAANHRRWLLPTMRKMTGRTQFSGDGMGGRLQMSLSAESFVGLAILMIVSLIGMLDPFA
ncbi:CopD family protein [Alteraurantiacibacter buctensis]|uniref:Copper resistance protein D domain-containing protein n=1 Tax=Alteraurantiacibacter buctensis TaxID=1503981 RepID=A0A844Z5E0_9SPHN|nr:CopD family protein [Alteraurantiacibacter buctensis]MXO73043.1 hypothetical protein [Alteraurantiacibacter buctensis]